MRELSTFEDLIARYTYRYQRLMLTSTFRTFLKIGVPSLVLATILSAVFASDERRKVLDFYISDLTDAVKSRPEFAVSELRVEGVSEELSEEIISALNVPLPTNSFDLDIEAIRVAVADLSFVSDAMVRLGPDGIVRVIVKEHAPVAVWHSEEGIFLLSAEGHTVRHLDEYDDHGKYILVAGRRADKAIGDAVGIQAKMTAMGLEIAGLVRVGERRWDVVLTSGIRIKLPAEEPLEAMKSGIVAHYIGDAASAPVSVIDMRVPDRPTIRKKAPKGDEGL